MRDVEATLDAVWKLESARIIAALTRLVHDVGLAEELAQDALVAALEQWRADGVPDNPAGWLTTVAKRRAVDQLRRSARADRATERAGREQARRSSDEPPDDVLRLMLLTCHPVLPPPYRVALTLRLVGGLTAAEIGRAFLLDERTVVRRVAAARQALAEAGVRFELPPAGELADRIAAVLDVLYLIFNEGYTASAGDDLIRPGLCLEALRLARLLAGLAPGTAEVHGLVALLEIQASRSATRAAADGTPVPLAEQDRGRWDPLLIRRGFTALLRARDTGEPPGRYVLQAAIAACHARARRAEETDWAEIAALYDALIRLLPTPVVRLNRAVAVGAARGPAAGLAAVDELAGDPALRDYHLLPGVRADLLARVGRTGEARREYDRAAALAGTAAERTFLRRRAAALPAAPPSARTLDAAVREFLDRDRHRAGTLRSYRQTLRRLCLDLGPSIPLADVTADAVARVFDSAWGGAASRTWNRHRAAVRSFGGWAGRAGLDAGLARRAEPAGRTAPMPAAELAALCARPGVAVRERALWLLLAESGAAVSAALALDVADLDLPRRRARVGTGWLTWGTGTAEVLPELVAGRRCGPLFRSDRRPAPARRTAAADLCPETGRRRLSYERAEYLFKRASGGRTLRQLRTRG
ncbi:hypothetical protein Athai_56750 [Actinocatenispora thailandica]|uniref:RNA polymerase subunit sigma n=1 Tax=Actinocatenispora thailandica TaxID=227318 RepID=A0A7R7DUP9_9ACTN|nr:DUF6596 domain-containing protein [Actinocatenispora thailandica]BCJ38172.1 hypothetical protein Athai_56750 [Actinocatenispora thailandica]